MPLQDGQVYALQRIVSVGNSAVFDKMGRGTRARISRGCRGRRALHPVDSYVSNLAGLNAST